MKKKLENCKKGCQSLDVGFINQHSQKVTELGNNRRKNIHQERLTLLKQGSKDCVQGWREAWVYL